MCEGRHVRRVSKVECLEERGSWVIVDSQPASLRDVRTASLLLLFCLYGTRDGSTGVSLDVDCQRSCSGELSLEMRPPSARFYILFVAVEARQRAGKQITRCSVATLLPLLCLDGASLQRPSAHVGTARSSSCTTDWCMWNKLLARLTAAGAEPLSDGLASMSIKQLGLFPSLLTTTQRVLTSRAKGLIGDTFLIITHTIRM